MTFSIMLVFFFSCVAFSFSPGAGAIATMSRSIEDGIVQARYNIIGLQLALLVHLIIVSVGLGAFIASSEIAFDGIKYIGGSYLIYLGLMKIKNSGNSVLRNAEMQSGKLKSLANGFVVNITNPKSIVFLVAFLPQFVDSSDSSYQYFKLGLFILLVDCIAMFSYASLAHVLLRHLSEPLHLKRLNLMFGAVFIILAVMLLMSGRH
ncbi:LysE family transporter [Aeromonas molluscorum]|uniref:Amino acid efflux protein n=1 Tax=Aeromonas molluscorum 848 TaxID=1268236 RepID=R1H4L4_9GAMM|nr:LysE family transporter [Aeromonas molluscorum]EOD53414.1 amino acid efflux protein [Aeromonas molluscorum 848]